MYRWTTALLLTAALTMASTAHAQSSGGSGGPVGEQEDWPCPGCLFGTPEGYDPSQPTPLLVVFHGDEGSPSYVHSTYYRSRWGGDGPAYQLGFLVLSLQCPIEHGCDLADPEGDPSWWRWRSSDYYVPEWVGQQIDAVEAAYDVDLRRIYGASFSGGSSFLRYYGFHNADRFAGLLIGGGGGRPSRDCLDACKIPVFLSIGSDDYLYDLAQGTREYAEECGHELVYSEHPGIDHTIIEEDLPVALAWLLERPHLCIEPTDPVPEPPPTGGAGGEPPTPATGGGAGDGQPMPPPAEGGSGGSPTSSTGGTSVSTGAQAGASGAANVEALDDAGDEGGCACHVGGRANGQGWLMMLGAGLVGLARRRRGVRSRRQDAR